MVSDIPGVRTVVQISNFGAIAKPGDPIDLADKIRQVFETKHEPGKAIAVMNEVYLNPVPLRVYSKLLK